MKYRILKDQKNLYSVQYKYRFWPFWFFDEGINEGGGSVIYSWESAESARSRIDRLIRDTYKKSRWEVVDDVIEDKK